MDLFAEHFFASHRIGQEVVKQLKSYANDFLQNGTHIELTSFNSLISLLLPISISLLFFFLFSSLGFAISYSHTHKRQSVEQIYKQLTSHIRVRAHSLNRETPRYTFVRGVRAKKKNITNTHLTTNDNGHYV